MDEEVPATNFAYRQDSFQSVYTELSHDDRDIRIVCLHPGLPGTDLSCDLIQTTLGDAEGTYEALSYCWGEDEMSHFIRCNELEVPIRPNIASALRQLRLPDRPRRLWVDCLSINQYDTEERGHQVSFMVEIFQQAESVLVWLGETADDSDKVMDFIAGLDPTAALHHFRSCRDPRAVVPSNTNILELGGNEWLAQINSFLTRGWFRRIWVQQEVASGARVTVLCGSKTARWQQLFAFGWMLTHWGAFTPESARKWASIRRGSAQATRIIRKIHLYRDRKSKPSLLFVLNSARSCEATDPRDRIYAVQHLSRHGPDSSVFLRPNYDMELRGMCLELAENYLTSRGVAIISYAGRATQADLSLPSWAPDWGCRRNERFMGLPDWNAGGRNQARGTIVPDLNKHIVSLRAVVVGSIANLGGVMEDEHDRESSYRPRCFRNAEIKTWGMINPGAEYVHGGTQEQAYLRTLVADNPQDHSLRGQTSHAVFWAEFTRWREWLYSEDAEADSLATRPQYDLNIERTGTFRRRQFGLTTTGLMCLAPAGAQEGDKVCVLLGLDRPMVIREQGVAHEFIGECYVHGAMQGQFQHSLGWGDMKFV